jgi:hypothetical protein
VWQKTHTRLSPEALTGPGPLIERLCLLSTMLAPWTIAPPPGSIAVIAIKMPAVLFTAATLPV